MTEKKTLYYDVSGRNDGIYIQHFKSDGFVQDWLHFHSKYELSLVLSGNVDVVSNGQLFNCNKPHFRLHRPFIFHTANACKSEVYECYVFYFTEESLRDIGIKFDLARLFREGLVISEIKGDTLECARLLASMTLLDIDERMRLIILSGLLTLIEKNMRNHEAMRGAQSFGYITDVLAYINEHYAEKISAAELSKHFYISEQKLNIDFKKSMNDTLHHYIMTVRISHSAMLIARGMTPLAASIECGFTDESHFAKTFKIHIGLTPCQFSKQVGSRVEFSGDFNEKNTIV
jgi:AraC-like DNA-binding protein